MWRLLNISTQGANANNLWLLGRESQLPPTVQYDAVLLIMWHLWKARNSRIFDNVRLTDQAVLRKIVTDMDLWRPRFRHEQERWNA